MNPPSPSLALNNVHVRYPRSQEDALRDCSFTIRPGEHVALLGLNGSGKTTLLMAIAGLLPTSGQIVIDGIPLSPQTLEKVRARIGFLFANPEDQLLFPRVLHDVAYGLIRRNVPQQEALSRAQSILDELGVGGLAEREPYELSHGQQLRVALAGVLVTEPSLLLLDEATAALDPPGRRALARILRASSSAFLLATHDLESAVQCCDRFLLVEQGTVVADTSRLDDLRPKIDHDGT